MITTYRQARTYLESFINTKMYDSITIGSGDQFDPLGRMQYLLQLLGDPQQSFPCIVVSGTSGKGSTAYFLARMLAGAGYKTGLTISPHLQKINERLQISAHDALLPIKDEVLICLLNDILPIIESLATSSFGPPTYYEILIAMVLVYFSQQKVDIAVVEVGLEGKFEATNLLNPFIFILTNISLDHTAILGRTIGKIADEATYRIKSLQHATATRHHPLIITGVTQPSVIKLVMQRARAANADVVRLFQDFNLKNIQQDMSGVSFDFHTPSLHFAKLHTSLLGAYQATNAALAIEAAIHLNQYGFTISESQIRNALVTAYFPGRFELRMQRGVECIIDGAHNPAKIRGFLASLHKLYGNRSKIFLIAFKKDKSIARLLCLINNEAEAVVVTMFTSSIDMGKNLGMELQDVRTFIAEAGFKDARFTLEGDAKKALEVAYVKAKELNGIIVVTGSLYLAGEISEIMDKA